MPACGLVPYICPGAYMGIGMPGIAAPGRPAASLPEAVGGETLPMGPLTGAGIGIVTGWAGASASYSWPCQINMGVLTLEDHNTTT